MTRRDYVLIAEVLRATQPHETLGGVARCAWCDVARTFANRLAAENPRFDRARFLKACGVEL